jgi:uncharacterized protein (DUF305 family)
MRSDDPGRVLSITRRRGAHCVWLILGLAVVTFGAKAPEGQHAQHAMEGGERAAPDIPVRVSKAKPFGALIDDAMTVMDDGMKGAPMTGNPDHDFAAMMIPHHQGAIDMAKAELLYGRDPVLRRLAHEILVTQASEITVMQRELGKKSSSAPMEH